MICYIGLGSNLGNSINTLKAALDELDEHPQINLLSISSLYGSKPFGPQDQPDYINAVAQIETSLKPHPLLDVFQQIENNHKRIRSNQRWGPRTLDLDLLLYGNEQLETARLNVPHPRMTERSFVLYPLAEINSGLQLPDGQPLLHYLAKVPDTDLWKLEEPNE